MDNHEEKQDDASVGIDGLNPIRQKVLPVD
jgi:hypothetical protein